MLISRTPDIPKYTWLQPDSNVNHLPVYFKDAPMPDSINPDPASSSAEKERQKIILIDDFRFAVMTGNVKVMANFLEHGICCLQVIFCLFLKNSLKNQSLKQFF